MPTVIGFAAPALLTEHFGKHNSWDFKFRDEREYERNAINFLKADVNVIMALELVRSNGEIVRFCPNSNEFAVLRPTGHIRTYYKPMPERDAPHGYPIDKTHGYSTNLEYFRNSA